MDYDKSQVLHSPRTNPRSRVIPNKIHFIRPQLPNRHLSSLIFSKHRKNSRSWVLLTKKDFTKPAKALVLDIQHAYLTKIRPSQT